MCVCVAWDGGVKGRRQKRGLVEAEVELRNKATGECWKNWAEKTVLRGQQREVKAGAKGWE